MRSLRLILAGVLCLCPTAARADKPTPPPAPQGAMDFAKDIQPILKQHCLKCHNTDKQKGGLDLTERAATLEGGNGGVVIVPGEAAESRLLAIVAGLDPDLKMPPEGPALAAAD